jgi:hypothetical protein
MTLPKIDKPLGHMWVQATLRFAHILYDLLCAGVEKVGDMLQRNGSYFSTVSNILSPSHLDMVNSRGYGIRR